MRKIFYLGSYRSKYIAERKPEGSSAEDYKMQYLISTMKRLDYHVVVISILTFSVHGWHPRKVLEVDEQETHVYLESYDTKKKVLCSAAAVLRLIFLGLYLLMNLKSTDTLLVYHSQLLSWPVRITKVLKRFGLILEIEEIFYKEARTPKEVKRKNIEIKLINAADRFLSINEIIRLKYCNFKPTIISYGAYFTPPKYVKRFDDGKIHLVYAGVINSTHGSHKAVEIMRYLNDGYRLHIYGFGLENEIENLKRIIYDANLEFCNERILYHGQKSGKEFDIGLQHCHIGLNFNISIKPDAGKYAFPSKIPSYLGHGLNVLTYRIPSVVNSPFSQYVHYYEDEAPKAIVQAIKNIHISPYETQVEILKDFDRVFINELRNILG